jgi:hypothetical protein
MGVLRAFAASREKSCPPQSKPRSLTGTRRHGEGGSNSYRGFSAPPRLRENIRAFYRPKPGFSRGDAETRSTAEPSASVVSPCLRASVSASVFFQNMNPDLSPRREDAKKNIEWGFLRVFAASRLRERDHARPNRHPDLSRGHEGTGKTDAINIDVSPRLRASARTSGLFTDRSPVSLAETRRRGVLHSHPLQWVSPCLRVPVSASGSFQTRTRISRQAAKTPRKTLNGGSSRLCGFARESGFRVFGFSGFRVFGSGSRVSIAPLRRPCPPHFRTEPTKTGPCGPVSVDPTVLCYARSPARESRMPWGRGSTWWW